MANAEPFLRWAGGKRWLARSLAPLIRKRLEAHGTYYEPFLGSGAMFFSVSPQKAVLSDLNEELMLTFRAVASDAGAIIEILAKMPTTAAEYDRVRRSQPASTVERAVRFIYLNRNCWGGLYRENRSGMFNVPYGGGSRNHGTICTNGIIESAATVLSQPGVELRVWDFEEPLGHAGAGDVVYCDPIFREVTRNQFDRYGKTIFGWEDQIRLGELALRAFRRGAVVILSNTTSNEIRALYPGAGVVAVMREKGLGPSANHHNRVEHLLILDPSADWSTWTGVGPLETPT